MVRQVESIHFCKKNRMGQKGVEIYKWSESFTVEELLWLSMHRGGKPDTCRGTEGLQTSAITNFESVQPEWWGA